MFDIKTGLLFYSSDTSSFVRNFWELIDFDLYMLFRPKIGVIPSMIAAQTVRVFLVIPQTSDVQRKLR